MVKLKNALEFVEGKKRFHHFDLNPPLSLFKEGLVFHSFADAKKRAIIFYQV
jgi:hypothetical protein